MLIYCWKTDYAAQNLASEGKWRHLSKMWPRLTMALLVHFFNSTLPTENPCSCLKLKVLGNRICWWTHNKISIKATTACNTRGLVHVVGCWNAQQINKKNISKHDQFWLAYANWHFPLPWRLHQLSHRWFPLVKRFCLASSRHVSVSYSCRPDLVRFHYSWREMMLWCRIWLMPRTKRREKNTINMHHATALTILTNSCRDIFVFSLQWCVTLTVVGTTDSVC
jgi:hypothetical protein